MFIIFCIWKYKITAFNFTRCLLINEWVTNLWVHISHLLNWCSLNWISHWCYQIWLIGFSLFVEKIWDILLLYHICQISWPFRSCLGTWSKVLNIHILGLKMFPIFYVSLINLCFFYFTTRIAHNKSYLIILKY